MNNSEKNQQTVIKSAIVAKATVKRNGRIHFIVVFQESTRHEFYWLFQAKSARSPRRSWKFAGYFERDCGIGLDYKPYTDFGSFVEHYARLHHAEVLTVRVLHTRRLASLRTKTTFESIHSDWTPRINSTDPRDYKIGKRMFDSKIKGRALDWQR